MHNCAPHQPHNLAAIRALTKLRPGLPQVACFDTAFHRTQSALAQAYALPPGITDAGVKRYGFHGLSYQYIADVLPGHLGAHADGLDALVFTGGIGEHAAPVREMICKQAAWLGVELDAEANRRHATRISTADSRASAWVIATDEELVIARETSRALAARP